MEETNIFWVFGSFYYCNKIVEDIKNSIGNHSIFICNNTETNIEQFKAELLSDDLFNDNKKLFIFKEIPEGKNSAATNKNFISFLELFNNANNSYAIVLGIKDTEKPTLFKYVKEKGKVMSFSDYIDRNKAIEWVANRITEEKTISGKEIEYIVDSIGIENKKGISTDRLYNSVKKILAYTGKERKVTREIVFKVSDKYNNVIAFDLYDAIDKKDYDNCQRLLYKLCDKNGVKEGVTGLFFILAWRYKLIFLLKELLNKNKSEKEVVDELNKLVKLKREGVNEYMYFTQEIEDGKAKPYYNGSALNSALKGYYGKASDVSKYNRKDAFKAIICLQKCLEGIHGCNDVECLLLADNFFMTMCEKLDYKLLLNMRNFIGD